MVSYIIPMILYNNFDFDLLFYIQFIAIWIAILVNWLLKKYIDKLIESEKKIESKIFNLIVCLCNLLLIFLFYIDTILNKEIIFDKDIWILGDHHHYLDLSTQVFYDIILAIGQLGRTVEYPYIYNIHYRIIVFIFLLFYIYCVIFIYKLNSMLIKNQDFEDTDFDFYDKT